MTSDSYFEHSKGRKYDRKNYNKRRLFRMTGFILAP